MDDREIIAGLRSGHPQAPSWLMTTFQATVYGLCLRMLRHRQDAEDATQETFIRALGAIHRFDPARPLRPWLLGIAANRCRTALAGRSRRVTQDLVGETPDSRPSLLDPDDIVAEVDRAMDRLRPDYRLVFTLFHEQNLAYEEIAQVLKRPVGTIKTWLHRARTELADDLIRRGIHC